jgi:hypothetical protein
MTDRLEWTIEPRGDLTFVQLKGSVDEDADLAALAKDLKTWVSLRFDLSKIIRVNSCGVREWVNFMRSLPQCGPVALENCSPVVVAQLNMISNFVGPARVLSVQAPFVCGSCSHEENVLLEVEAGKTPVLGEVACPKCKAAMTFDDIEDVYFAFLR